MKPSSLLLVAALSGSPAFAQADECSAATDLGTGPTTITFDTNVCADTGTQATTSAEQQCATLSDDVWFRWTAATTGDVTFDTCNNATFDTEIGVWEGSDCSSFVGLDCNDDNSAAGCANLTSLITLPVVAGQTYYIQIGHWDATDGNVYGAGTLTIADFVDPCLGVADDNFEPNDSCPAPSAITAGSYTGLFVSDVDPDYYSIMVPAGEMLEVDATDTGIDVTVNILDATCTQVAPGVGDGASYSNLTAAPQMVVIEVIWSTSNSGNTCTAYDLDIVLTPDPCANPVDDSFEENDACTSPSTITPGTYTGLFTLSGDADFYSIVVPDGDELDVTVVDTGVDVDLRQFDAACGLIQDFNTDGFVYLNTSGAPETVIFEIYWDPTNSTGSCTDYDMTVDLTTPPPTPDCLMADVFEPNLDCTSATSVGSGTYTGLNVTDTDQDYYAVAVAAGATINVDITFVDDFADLDLYLWDPAINCDTAIAGNNSGDALDVGFTASDDETVSYTNVSGAAQQLIIEVDVYDFSTGTCNNYDMTITGATGGTGGALGVPFCDPGNPNSTGVPGAAGATGSASVAANNVTLTASNLPPGQFGIFVTATVQVPGVPIGDGLLCLGGQIGRYQQFSQIFQVDPSGFGSLAIDLTQIPTPSIFVQAMPGETRSFQAWHRDLNTSGPTSNFTEGIGITWTP